MCRWEKSPRGLSTGALLFFLCAGLHVQEKIELEIRPREGGILIVAYASRSVSQPVGRTVGRSVG